MVHHLHSRGEQERLAVGHGCRFAIDVEAFGFDIVSTLVPSICATMALLTEVFGQVGAPETWRTCTLNPGESSSTKSPDAWKS
jgi:hypothetical protein